MHMNNLRHVGLDFFSISLSASVVFNDVGAITLAGHFLRGGRGCKYGLKGLPNKIEIIVKLLDYDEPELIACF